jgi:hypothetical protein
MSLTADDLELERVDRVALRPLADRLRAAALYKPEHAATLMGLQRLVEAELHRRQGEVPHTVEISLADATDASLRTVKVVLADQYGIFGRHVAAAIAAELDDRAASARFGPQIDESGVWCAEVDDEWTAEAP